MRSHAAVWAAVFVAGVASIAAAQEIPADDQQVLTTLGKGKATTAAKR